MGSDFALGGSHMLQRGARTCTIVGLMAVMVLGAGCSRLGLDRIGGAGRVELDGTRFRARAEAPRTDRRAFQVRVRPAAGVVEGAQEAGRFEANKYCLQRFGTSDITWTVNPDLPAEALTVQDNTLYLQGRCIAR